MFWPLRLAHFLGAHLFWLLCLGNFIGAYLVGYYLHVWDAQYGNLVYRNYPLSRDKMRARVWKAIRWTILIGLLVEADFASGIYFGRTVLLALIPGGLLGACHGVWRFMWDKFDATEKRLAAGEADDDE